MIRTSILIAIAFALGGCQVKDSLIKAGDTISCAVKPGDIGHWVSLEQRYQSAAEAQKVKLLAKARKDSNPTPLAILLSQPGNSETELSRSLTLFRKMELQPDSNCLTDRYIYVRYQYARGTLQLQQNLNSTTAQRKALLNERNKLLDQIRALTEIERDLSIQKKEDR
ncbi:hypothetical protein [Amphritea sp. HPY]|uniref:hypothetical protein n=1 Tax=Amphritea sp. HPY TaxID=3421652 RepID=UPI003D7D78E6